MEKKLNVTRSLKVNLSFNTNLNNKQCKHFCNYVDHLKANMSLVR